METGSQNQLQGQKTLQLCTFEINKKVYGIDLLHVREVSNVPTVTRVYHAGPSVSGYINIRGEIHLLLDLRTILGQPASKDYERQCVIIFKSGVGELFGSIVDAVRGVETVRAGQIEDYKAFRNSTGLEENNLTDMLASGVCKMPDYLITILDCRRFLGTVKNAS